jgi:hypothetical protein
VIVKIEEALSMVRNVLIPYIEDEESKDGNLHAFDAYT